VVVAGAGWIPRESSSLLGEPDFASMRPWALDRFARGLEGQLREGSAMVLAHLAIGLGRGGQGGASPVSNHPVAALAHTAGRIGDDGTGRGFPLAAPWRPRMGRSFGAECVRRFGRRRSDLDTAPTDRRHTPVPRARRRAC